MQQNCTTPADARANSLLDAAKERGDDFSIAVAFDILKRRHRQREDVRAKIIELAERKAVKR